jgi:hypothetical protein
MPHVKVLVRGKPISVDTIIYIAIINPIMAIPQLYLILTTDGKGVSTITWVTWLSLSFIWLAYGIKHKLKPIILIQSCWIVIDSAIVLALILKS